MYSRKRDLRLFRVPAFTVADQNRYTYRWSQMTGAPLTPASAMSVDDTGTVAILANAIGTDGEEGVYITRDVGTTWTRSVNGISFPSLVGTFGCCIARSTPNIMYCANGQSAVATGFVYKSTDFGASWTEVTVAGQRNWSNIICNSTGSIVLAAVSADRLYRSTDGGSSWTGLSGTVTTGTHGPMCMSEDGQTIVFGTTNGSRLQISRNGGTTFGVITLVGISTWTGLSCSADGQVIFASSSSSTVMCALSTDNGVTWTSAINPSGRASNTGYQRTACSLNGNKLVVTEGQIGSPPQGYIWVSLDKGATWIQEANNNTDRWQGLAMTPSGRIIFAGAGTSAKAWVGIGV